MINPTINHPQLTETRWVSLALPIQAESFARPRRHPVEAGCSELGVMEEITGPTVVA